MTMDLKSRFKNTTAMRYTEWFSDKEAFVFPPKDALDAAMRKAKKDMKAQTARDMHEKIKKGENIFENLQKMREETLTDKKIQDVVGFQFKDW